MVNIVAPVKAQFLKDKLQYLEVVVLLITYNVNVLVKSILCKSLVCSTQILSHVYRSTVATEKKFLVKAVCSKITPYRTVLVSLKHTFSQTLLNKSFTKKVSL